MGTLIQKYVFLGLICTLSLGSTFPETAAATLKATLGRYSDIPTTMAEARAAKWELDDDAYGCTNFGKFSGFRWIEPNDPAIGLLFTYDGDLCGVQMLVPYNIFQESGTHYRYDLEPMYQLTTVRGKDFWTLTAYFCEPKDICRKNEPAPVDDDRIRNTLIYQIGPTPNEEEFLRRVPYYRPDANEAGWSPEHCIDGMGYHNIWHVEDFTASNCSRFQPTLILFNKEYGFLQGFGFWVFGQSAKTSERLEKPPGPIVAKLMGDDATPCITDTPTTTIHFFSIPDPAHYTCPKVD